jgi:hypothetical protein
MLLASDYDKRKYLNASDLDHEKKIRIKEVTEEELGVGKDKEVKLVVWFTNEKRGLSLNKINLRTLKGAFGDPVAGWKDKVIAMFTMMASNGKPGLRVRILPPKEPTATAEPAQRTGPSGNGAAAKPPPAADPELEPDPILSAADKMDDSIPF